MELSASTGGQPGWWSTHGSWNRVDQSSRALTLNLLRGLSSSGSTEGTCAFCSAGAQAERGSCWMGSSTRRLGVPPAATLLPVAASPVCSARRGQQLQRWV